MAVEMTYVALKPLRVGGKRREPGQLVPEAADWPRRSAWIDQGKITPVPKTTVDANELAAAENAYAELLEAKRVREAPPVEEQDDGGATSDPVEAPGDDQLTREHALALSKEDLKTHAERQGIEVDGRWSTEKIVDALFGESEEDDGEE